MHSIGQTIMKVMALQVPYVHAHAHLGRRNGRKASRRNNRNDKKQHIRRKQHQGVKHDRNVARSNSYIRCHITNTQRLHSDSNIWSIWWIRSA